MTHQNFSGKIRFMSSHVLARLTMVLVILGTAATASGQTYYQVTNTSGTSTAGGITTTVTSAGSVSSGIPCGSIPVHYGVINPGGNYTFAFSAPVTNVRIKLMYYASSPTGSLAQVRINGSPYSLTSGNITGPHNVCGEPSMIATSGGNIVKTTPTGGGTVNGQIDISGTINSVAIYPLTPFCGVSFELHFANAVTSTPITFVNGATQSMSMCQNAGATSINSLLTANDPSTGNSVSWVVGSSPSHGTLGGFAGTATSSGGNITPTGLTYTPTPGYSGTDVFSVMVADGANTDVTTINVAVNPTPNVSSLSVSGTSICTPNASNLTMTSSTLANGLYSVNYSLGSPNSGSYSAAFSVSGGSGSFSSPTLFNSGTTPVTITSVSDYGTGCGGSAFATNNINVNATPNVAGLSVSAYTVCTGFPTTVFLNGALANGTYNVNYTLGSPNFGSYSTAVSTFAGSGSFTTPTLSNSGTTSVTINSVTNTSSGCNSSSGANGSIIVNPTPIVSGLGITGSTVCATFGSAISISGSLANFPYVFNYTLSGANSGTYNSSATSISGGTGSFTTVALPNAGTTTVTFNTVTNASTGCSISASPSASVTVNPNPITAGLAITAPSICTNYQDTIRISSALTDATYSISYTLGAPNAGTYTATVTTTAGAGMFLTPFLTAAGSTSISINSVTNTATSCVSTSTATNNITVISGPNIYNMTGGGTGCLGSSFPIGLSGSEIGVYYQLYISGVPYGSPVFGSGGALSFGNFTNPGVFTAGATRLSTGCKIMMNGSSVVVINPLPAVVSMAGGGYYCIGGPGVTVGLAGSAVGINYQLYRGGTPVGAATAGVGTVLSFGLQTTAGTYTATAINPVTGCTSNMTGSVSVSVNPLPAVFTMTGGGSFCSGGSGVLVGLSGSASGVSYQLFRNGSLLPGSVAGTGSAITFGAQTTPGTYTALATTTSTTCTINMSGSSSVAVNSLPAVYAVTGGGSFCSGGTGVAVGLNNSQSGVNYQLYRGGFPVGSPVAGTGAAISFGLQTVTGTYTANAVNATTGCSASMTGSASVATSSAPTVYSMTGGGAYCSGGSGVSVGLSSSQAGISYQLYRGGTAVGSPVSGSGAALSFGSMTTVGVYTAVATGTCTSNMTGSVTVTINAVPATFTVTGGGSTCSGTAGVPVGLSGSETGTTYQLYRGTVAVGTAVAGTGSALSLGYQTVNGIYTIIATKTSTGCTTTMTGSATVSIASLPAIVAVTGGGSYCSGGVGVRVGLAGSVTGTTYQLYLGAIPVGSALSGIGGALDFGLQTTTGTYTAIATNSSGCTSNMSGSATVSVSSLPAVYSVTGGGNYCSGGSGVHIGINSSASGVTYRLICSGATMATTTGTGFSRDFGLFTTAGTYTVTATNGLGCSANMTGSATVAVNPNPSVSGSIYTVAPGASITLTASVSGGTWTSSNLFQTTIGSSSGVVTGVSLGSAVISYTLPTGCYGVRMINVTSTGLRHNPGTNASVPQYISVTPNPFTNTFTVKGIMPGITDDEELALEIRNMAGQLVYSGNILAVAREIDKTIQLENVPQGTYLLTVTGKSGRANFRIVKLDN